MVAESAFSAAANEPADEVAACWIADEDGTLSGGAAYASGGMSTSCAVEGRSSMISGLPRPTVVLACATGVFTGAFVTVLRVRVVVVARAVVAYVLELLESMRGARRLAASLGSILLVMAAVELEGHRSLAAAQRC